MNTPYGFISKYPEPEQHWGLLVGAILFSVAAHIGMMFVFGDWRLGSSGDVQTKMKKLYEDDRVQPMPVERLMNDPIFATAKNAHPVPPPQAEVDMSRHVDELSRSSPPAVTAPPPIPREALTPGVPQLSEAVYNRPIDTTPWIPRQEIAQIFDRMVQDNAAALPRHEIPLIERIPEAPDVVPSIELAGRQFGNTPAPPKPLVTPSSLDTEPVKGDYKPPAAIDVPPPVQPQEVSVKAAENRFAADQKEKHEAVKGFLTEEEKAAIQKQTVDAGKKAIEAAAAATKDGTVPGTAVDGKTADTETPQERAARVTQKKISNIRETVDYEPIDDLLSVGIQTYKDASEPDKVYFRVGIQPRTDVTAQVVPKDIIFLQDVSGSMGEQRIAYCRRAISEALAMLNTGDRFNVVAFRDTFENCFPVCAPATAANIEKARKFVEGMRAFGNTDVFASLKSLLNLQRDPHRPMIAYMITDGLPTAGEMESAQIIGDFSAINNGMMSVYMFGASQRANAYLIDMLTYCNRGSAALLRGNSWDIPEVMGKSCREIRNPIMGDVSVTFDTASLAEVYPRQTTNLYKDRPLELCGVCPASTKQIVCQIRGLASAKGYDSILHLDVGQGSAKGGRSDIKKRWVQQKMYHLVGEYSRQPRRDVMEEMVKLNKQYGVAIPYKTQLSKKKK